MNELEKMVAELINAASKITDESQKDYWQGYTTAMQLVFMRILDIKNKNGNL